LEGYIQASLIDINTSLRENTIPASNIASTSVSNENIPANIYDTKNWKILIGDGQTAEIFTKETPILDVIA